VEVTARPTVEEIVHARDELAGLCELEPRSFHDPVMQLLVL
jgi:hypothetical protein